MSPELRAAVAPDGRAGWGDDQQQQPPLVPATSHPTKGSAFPGRWFDLLSKESLVGPPFRTWSSRLVSSPPPCCLVCSSPPSSTLSWHVVVVVLPRFFCGFPKLAFSSLWILILWLLYVVEVIMKRWLFGFIIIASYTANLAAFLTVSRWGK